MRFQCKLLSPISPMLMVLLIGSGCPDRSRDAEKSATRSTSAPVQQGTRQEATDILSKVSSSSDGGKVVRHEQKIDITNRYQSAVMVTTTSSSSEGREGECSGILIAPRLVLTAASCVRAERQATASLQGTELVLDASACAASTAVTFVTYVESLHGEDLRSVHAEYKGEVRCHPLFKMVLSSDGGIASSTADLALVMLETAVKDVAPVRLADSVAKTGETLRVVGYARNQEWGGLHRKRLFGTGEVMDATSPGEGFLLANRFFQDLATGLGGGPCFREGESGIALVGIMSRPANGHAVVTGVHFHRDWILNELRQLESQR